MISLADYLDDVMERPWQWGECDCCHFGGDWVMAATGRDPLGPYRGTYQSRIGAARLILARGGLVSMVGIQMEELGFRQVGDPEHGDLAVMAYEIGTDDKAAGGAVVVRDGPWWLARGYDDIVGFHGDALAIWRVL